MKISVPTEFPKGLQPVPGDVTYEASLNDLTIGKSQTGNLKLNVFFVLTSDPPDLKPEDKSTVGEKILDTFSLQPQALWRLNDLVKEVTGNDMETGDYDQDEFLAYLKDKLLGTNWQLYIADEMTPQGQKQSRVQERKFMG